MGQYADNNYQTDSLDSVSKSDVNLSAIICYESVFPNIVRNFIARGANLLTIITNDGWFGLTSGPYQHSQYAVLRAVENRVSIIRCANTGISSFIDPTGRVLLKARLETRKDLVDYLPLNTEHTFYTRHGEWFGKIILLVCSLLILFNLFGWKLIRRQKG
ncbi:MAG: apolipoprotein N-acyltransferase [Calditrichia bacterium]